MGRKNRKHYKSNIHHKHRRYDLNKQFNGYYPFDENIYIKKYCENCGFDTDDKQKRPQQDLNGKFRCQACNSILKVRKINND